MERPIELGAKNKAQGTDNGPRSQVQHVFLSKLPGKPPRSASSGVTTARNRAGAGV
jgi:hypothetical protein